MQIVNPIANLNQIVTREHSDLQGLDDDDHSDYMPFFMGEDTPNIIKGLDGSKSATPAEDDLYYATDTKKIYYAFVANTWTEITTGFFPASPPQGSVIYRGSNKWELVTLGASGSFFKSNGATSPPSFEAVSTLLDVELADEAIATGTTERTIYEFTIPANTLGLNGGVFGKILIAGIGLQNTMVFTIKLNGNAVATFNVSDGNNGGKEYGKLEFFIFNNADTAVQSTALIGSFFDDDMQSSSANKAGGDLGKASGSEDSTSDITVTITKSGVGSTGGFTRKFAIALKAL